jgi:hypothetical protein
MDTQDYSEQLEAVFQAYTKSLDLDVALSVVPMTPEVKARLVVDPDLMARMALCDAHVQETLMEGLRALSTGAANDGVRFQALKELGRTVYPKRFREGGNYKKIAALKRVTVPEEWDAEMVARLNADMLEYVDASEFPTEAEYCYTRGLPIKKVKKHLKASLELMSAKRQAILIQRGWSGDEPAGGFLTKLAANADEFSLVDKHEVGGPNGDPIPIALIKRVVVGADGKEQDV